LVVTKPKDGKIEKTEAEKNLFFCSGEKIRLSRTGVFTSDGTEITHDQTREIFFRSLAFDESRGLYYIQISYERMYIEVEDTAWFVKSVKSMEATLSDGRTQEILSRDLQYSEDAVMGPALHLTLPDKQKARFLSPAYYDLLSRVKSDQTGRLLITCRDGDAVLFDPSRGRP
jgi:hypothetical protein